MAKEQSAWKTNRQKQPAEMLCKKRCEKSCKFHRKTPVLESPLIKVAGYATLFKKDSNTAAFPWNLRNF